MFLFFIIWNIFAIHKFIDIFVLFFFMTLVGFFTGSGFVNSYYYLFKDENTKNSEKEICTILCDVCS